MLRAHFVSCAFSPRKYGERCWDRTSDIFDVNEGGSGQGVEIWPRALFLKAGCSRFGQGSEVQMGSANQSALCKEGDHCLYRHYDSDGVLLYVGISLSIGTRTSAHRRAAPWFLDVARIEVSHFTSRADCALAERVAIYHEKPLHNRNRPKVSQADLVAVLDALPPRDPAFRPTPYAGTREDQFWRAAFDAVDFRK